MSSAEAAMISLRAEIILRSVHRSRRGSSSRTIFFVELLSKCATSEQLQRLPAYLGAEVGLGNGPRAARLSAEVAKVDTQANSLSRLSRGWAGRLIEEKGSHPISRSGRWACPRSVGSRMHLIKLKSPNLKVRKVGLPPLCWIANAPEKAEV